MRFWISIAHGNCCVALGRAFTAAGRVAFAIGAALIDWAVALKRRGGRLADRAQAIILGLRP